MSPYTVVDSHAAVMEGEACLYEAVVAALREDDDASWVWSGTRVLEVFGGCLSVSFFFGCKLPTIKLKKRRRKEVT